MSFSVDSNNFVEGVPGDTRGYIIDNSLSSAAFTTALSSANVRGRFPRRANASTSSVGFERQSPCRHAGEGENSSKGRLRVNPNTLNNWPRKKQLLNSLVRPVRQARRVWTLGMPSEQPSFYAWHLCDIWFDWASRQSKPLRSFNGEVDWRSDALDSTSENTLLALTSLKSPICCVADRERPDRRDSPRPHT